MKRNKQIIELLITEPLTSNLPYSHTTYSTNQQRYTHKRNKNKYQESRNRRTNSLKRKNKKITELLIPNLPNPNIR